MHEHPPAVFDDLTLIELRCAACHSILAPSNRAVVFPCTNCSMFWAVARDGLQSFDARYARPINALGPQEVLVWLPFWRVSAELSYEQRRMHSRADLHTLLGIRAPASASANANTAALHYYVPAYGALRAPRLDHAARDLTRLQPQLETGAYEEGETFHCFYGPNDARKLAYATWIQIIPGADARRIRSLRISCSMVELWYLPFGGQARELRSLLNGQRYERSAFRGVGH